MRMTSSWLTAGRLGDPNTRLKEPLDEFYQQFDLLIKSIYKIAVIDEHVYIVDT
jgi:hypothetical protein